jgi:hypothetical protein
MKILSSLPRIRLAALVVTIAGLATFVAAGETDGRLSIVLVAVSLVLFLLEVIFGIIDDMEGRADDRSL